MGVSFVVTVFAVIVLLALVLIWPIIAAVVALVFGMFHALG